MTENLFAWASIDENGHASGGEAGDQTGREVKIGNYYDFGQNYVLRFRSSSVGRCAAKIAKSLAKNNNIGYDQAQRFTLYSLAQSANWDFNELKKLLKSRKVECDCSSFAATVINLAFGKKVVPCFTTSTIRAYYDPVKLQVMKLSDAKKKWHKGDMPFKAGKHIIINI